MTWCIIQNQALIESVYCAGASTFVGGQYAGTSQPQALCLFRA